MKKILLAEGRKFLGYLKKDFLLLIRRRRYLYLFILLPLIIAGLFLFALNPSDYRIKAGVCNFDTNSMSRQAFANFKGFEPIFLEKQNCTDNLISMIKAGDVSLGLEVPVDFSSNIENLEQSKITVYYDNTDIALANLLSWKVDSSLGAFEREIIDSLNSELNTRISSARSNIEFFTEMVSVSPSLEERVGEIDSDLKTIGEMDTEFLIDPVWTDKKPVYEEGLKKSAAVAFIFPILALFVVLLLASTSIIYDKKTGFLTRVRSSTSPFLYLLAKLVFFIVLVFAQFLIIMVLFLLYGATYSYSFFSLLNIIVYIAVIDSLLGIIVGLISNNEGVAVLFSLIISFPLMLISGIFFPIQTLPRAVQYLTSIMPLNYQILASKSILLFNQGISNTWVYFAVVLFALVYWLIGRD